MRAGRLKDRVAFEKPEQVKNPQTGAIEKTWRLVARRSAEIRHLDSTDKASLGSELTESKAKLLLRYDSALVDINTTWRVVDRRTNKVYEIEHHDPTYSGMRFIELRVVNRSR